MMALDPGDVGARLQTIVPGQEVVTLSLRQMAPLNDQFTTYTGDVRLRYALGRTWATYAEYLFYYYTFNRNLTLIPGIPPGLTRNGLRVGVTLWVPVRERK